jgi:hypothetical protein
MLCLAVFFAAKNYEIFDNPPRAPMLLPLSLLPHTAYHTHAAAAYARSMPTARPTTAYARPTSPTDIARRCPRPAPLPPTLSLPPWSTPTAAASFSRLRRLAPTPPPSSRHPIHGESRASPTCCTGPPPQCRPFPSVSPSLEHYNFRLLGPNRQKYAILFSAARTKPPNIRPY